MQWKLTDFSEDSPPNENILKGLKEWLSLELFLSPILNPGSPLINTSHTKSFSKAILTKTVFSYWDLQTIFAITSTKLLEFCHSSTRQSTHGSALQHLALPHLLTGFSLQVLFPWMPEGIKSFFIFYHLWNTVRNRRHLCPDTQLMQHKSVIYVGHKGRKASAKKAEH